MRCLAILPGGDDEKEGGFTEEAIGLVKRRISELKLERIGEKEGMEAMREGFGGAGFGEVKELWRSRRRRRGRLDATAADAARLEKKVERGYREEGEESDVDLKRGGHRNSTVVMGAAGKGKGEEGFRCKGLVSVLWVYSVFSSRVLRR